jgi:hypothetical protein
VRGVLAQVESIKIDVPCFRRNDRMRKRNGGYRWVTH